MTEPLKMPPEIAAAINKVMEGVKRLTKDAENTHGSYKFTSIDDFLDLTRPLCVDAGLIIVQDEVGFEIIEGKSAWLKLTYTYTINVTSGATYGPLTRSIMVLASMGAQAFGAAQSYSLKQFMRALFQISTGDLEDADAHQQSQLPKAERKLDIAPEGKDFWGCADAGALNASQAKKEGLDGEHDLMRQDIRSLSSREDIRTWIPENIEKIKKMPRNWRVELRNELEEQAKELGIDLEARK